MTGNSQESCPHYQQLLKAVMVAVDSFRVEEGVETTVVVVVVAIAVTVDVGVVDITPTKSPASGWCNSYCSEDIYMYCLIIVVSNPT